MLLNEAPFALPSMASTILEHLTPPKTPTDKTSMKMTIVSMLPTPPSSPSPSPRKPVAIPLASAAALPTTLPSQPVKDAQVLTQLKSTPAANATSTIDTRSTPRITSTEPPSLGSPHSRTLDVLKRELRIDSWRCGAQTLRNTECRRLISKDNKNLIIAQLTSMTDWTRASPGFESALRKLVMLVHCYQHDVGRQKEARLEAWRLTFPSGSADGSEPEVPVEQLIRKALEPLSAECIAHSGKWACKRRIGGQKVQNCERTLQELIKQEIYSDDAKLDFFLKVLEWNRTCKTHQSSKQFKSVKAWKEHIMAVLPLPVTHGDQDIASNAPNEPQTPPRAQAGALVVMTPSTTEKKAVVIVETLPTPRASPGPTISPDTDPALYWPRAYDSSPFSILTHANYHASPKESHKLIRAATRRLLDARDLRDGYVYAYKVEGNEGYVKIGYTTRPVTDRHDEWSFECNRQTKPLYPSPPSAAATVSSDATQAAVVPAVLVPHARRVEALCHAELSHRRIRVYCSACLKQHVEWFEVSAMEVTAVIQKWSRWMATRPYELLQLRSTSKWTLKAGEVQRTSSIEQFMQEIAAVPALLSKE